jgi:hypothetical protein
MTVSGIDAAAGADSYPLPIKSTAGSLSVNNNALTNTNAGDGAASSAPAPQPGIKVTIGTVPNTDILYTKLAPPISNKLTWATPPIDGISQLMENNLKSHSQSGDLPALFSGLGSRLWNDFLATQSDFHQAAVIYRPSYSNAADADSAAANAVANTNALQNAKAIQNNISLKIYTASGKEVDIAIIFGGDANAIKDSLSIDIHTSESLSVAEQVAIAKLSKGFDAALQGIGKDSTEVDVSGLLDFDTKVLSAVDLNVRAAPQLNALRSLDLHVDANRRSFALQSEAGNVSVNVNLSSPAPLGSADQQQSAVQRYLDQFDAANRRGHGDAALADQFKNAFAQLYSSHSVVHQSPTRALFASRLSTEDRSVLSGLADFQASMSGDFDNSAAYGFVTEAGHLDYQVAQNTQTRGTDKNSGLSLIQTQTATLESVFTKSRSGVLDTETGNYDIYRINDNTSTTTSFEYANDKLKNASVVTLLNQSEQYEKLINHKAVARKETPYSKLTTEDISAKLQPLSAIDVRLLPG